MRKQFFILVFLILGFSSGSIAGGQTLKFAATEWPPYTGVNLPFGGLAGELVTAIFERVGYDVKFVFRPWLRAQNMVKKGELDGMGIAWYTDVRAVTMLYSRPYILTDIVLIKHRDDLNKYSEKTDYENKHFGILRGYGYLNLVASDTIKKTVVDRLEQALEMLSIKRIDLTLEERLNAHYKVSLLSRELQDTISFVEKPLQEKTLHITVSKNIKNHKQIIADFNQGLDIVVNDGSYSKIINSYNPLPKGITSAK